MAKLRDRILVGRPIENGIADFDLQLFVKLCEMLSSDQPGERAAAASKASLMLKAAGLNWRDIVKDRSTLSDYVANGKSEDVETRARRYWKR